MRAGNGGRRGLGLAGALAAGALVLVACGGTPDRSGATPATTATGGSTSAVLSAYGETTSAASADITFSVDVSGADGVGSAATASGVESFADKTAQLTVHSAAQTVVVRVIPPELYLQLPAADRAKAPGGRPWVSVDLAEVPGAGGSTTYGDVISDADLPTETLSMLRDLSARGVRRIGPATIDGVPTTGYAATVDLPTTAGPAGASPQTHSPTVPVEVWIDSHGRVRRTHAAVRVSASGRTVTAVVTVELSDFGVAVHVAPPPAGQVNNITSVIRGSSGSTSAGGTGPPS